MKTHPAYEFVFETLEKSFSGNSPEEVFNAIDESVYIVGMTVKTRAKGVFETVGITAEVSDVNDKEKFYDNFFKAIQDAKKGCWKWYAFLYNDEFWRYDSAKNDIVRRLGLKGRKHHSVNGFEAQRRNIQISIQRRRENHELAKEIASKAGAARWRKMTQEERVEMYRRYWQGSVKKRSAMTPEEYKEYLNHVREAQQRRRSREKAEKEARHE